MSSNDKIDLFIPRSNGTTSMASGDQKIKFEWQDENGKDLHKFVDLRDLVKLNPDYFGLSNQQNAFNTSARFNASSNKVAKILEDKLLGQEVDVNKEEGDGVEEANALSYCSYVLVENVPKLKRKHVKYWGYTSDPWARLQKHLSKRKGVITRENHKMVILHKCTSSNIPSCLKVSTSHSFALAFEHAVGSFSSDFTPINGAHSGNGNLDDPTIQQAAKNSGFVKFVGQCLDDALKNGKPVTEEDCKDFYKCTNCGETFTEESKYRVHRRSQHQEKFPCVVCDIENLRSSSKYQSHIKTKAHKQNVAEVNKAKGKKPKAKKEKRDGEPKQPANAWILWSGENREQVKQEYDLKGNDISSKLGELWKTLDKNEKSKYEQQADELKAEWKRQMAEFNKSWEVKEKPIKTPKVKKSKT